MRNRGNSWDARNTKYAYKLAVLREFAGMSAHDCPMFRQSNLERRPRSATWKMDPRSREIREARWGNLDKIHVTKSRYFTPTGTCIRDVSRISRNASALFPHISRISPKQLFKKWTSEASKWADSQPAPVSFRGAPRVFRRVSRSVETPFG